MTLSTDTRMSRNAMETGCTRAYTFAEVLAFVREKYSQKKSLRRVAAEDYQGQITHSAIQRVLDGEEPRDPRIRSVFGLPAYQSVVVITGGIIPPGAQVIEAQFCECGQPFISNHPRRIKCFLCSPYKKTNKGEQSPRKHNWRREYEKLLAETKPTVSELPY